MDEKEKNELIAHAREVFQKVRALQDAGLICDDGDFVPSVHYPPITEYPDCDVETYLNGFEYPADGFMDIYVHVPFCIRHCLFCHYPGMVGECKEEKEKYIGYLMREIDLYRARFGVDRIRPRSILLGGGTPTYLPPKLFDSCLTGLDERFDLSACKQYNVDLDPNSLLGDDGLQRLESMRAHHITRLTIGVQSLDNEVLKLMNRPHDASMAELAIQRALDYGFDVNIEFIYGHPGETLDNWIDIMNKAVQLGTCEIQIYRLNVQSYGDMQGAIKRISRGTADGEIPDFETTMLMKQIAIDILAKNGYHETLRRVYSKDRRIFSHMRTTSAAICMTRSASA